MNKKKLQIGVDLGDKKVNKNPRGPEVDNPDFDLELDFNDTLVGTVDGVLINGDNEEVRLLFYHIKPNGVDPEDETIKCKGVAELRISRSRYNTITKDMGKSLTFYNTNQRKIDDYLTKGTHPMMFT